VRKYVKQSRPLEGTERLWGILVLLFMNYDDNGEHLSLSSARNFDVVHTAL
jgi:hypothetical protein